ncbi:MAG: adenine phosphoribosyltransferase [Bacteroidota bacterium]
MNLEQRIIQTIRNIPDFPKPGIQFKDITPLLADVQLSADITEHLVSYWADKNIDVVVGIESRGFIWGNALAQKMQAPFVPIRKKGRLPAETHIYRYELEYGSAEIEIHKDAIEAGRNVLIHDDLLATGGTALAAAELVGMLDARVGGFSFLVELGFLEGRPPLRKYSDNVHSLVTYR